MLLTNAILLILVTPAYQFTTLSHTFIPTFINPVKSPTIKSTHTSVHTLHSTSSPSPSDPSPPLPPPPTLTEGRVWDYQTLLKGLEVSAGKVASVYCVSTDKSDPWKVR